MANRKDLRSEVYHELGDLQEASIPPALVDEHLNRGIREFNRRVKPIRELVTVAVTEEDVLVDLAADYGRLALFYSDDETKRYVVDLETLQEYENSNLRNPGYKSFVAQEGQNLHFYPAISADEDGNATAVMTQAPPLFSDDSTDLDETIDPEAVVDWALHRILKRKDRAASVDHLTFFLEAVAQGKENARERSSSPDAVAPNAFYLTRGKK